MAFLPLVTPYSTSPSEMKADLIATAPMRCAGEQGVDGNVHLNDLSDTLSDFRFECPARFRHGLIDQGLERVGWHVGTLAAHLFNRLVKNAATHCVFDEFREITFFHTALGEKAANRNVSFFGDRYGPSRCTVEHACLQDSHLRRKTDRRISAYHTLHKLLSSMTLAHDKGVGFSHVRRQSPTQGL